MNEFADALRNNYNYYTSLDPEERKELRERLEREARKMLEEERQEKERQEERRREEERRRREQEERIAAAIDYYAEINREQAGPFKAKELEAKAASGKITGDSLIWTEGMADWVALSKYPSLAKVFAATPAEQAEVERKKYQRNYEQALANLSMARLDINDAQTATNFARLSDTFSWIANDLKSLPSSFDVQAQVEECENLHSQCEEKAEVRRKKEAEVEAAILKKVTAEANAKQLWSVLVPAIISAIIGGIITMACFDFHFEKGGEIWVILIVAIVSAILGAIGGASGDASDGAGAVAVTAAVGGAIITIIGCIIAGESVGAYIFMPIIIAIGGAIIGAIIGAISGAIGSAIGD